MEQINITNYVDLAAAHVTQYKNADQSKSKWFVRQNITSKDLAELPARLTEAEVFEILHFARKFELIAFNAGVQFQVSKSRKHFEPMIEGQKQIIEALTARNELLAAKLHKLMGEE